MTKRFAMAQKALKMWGDASEDIQDPNYVAVVNAANLMFEILCLVAVARSR